MTSLSQHARTDARASDGPPPAAKEWNRVHATKRLADEMTRARTEPGYEFSVLLVELEGLSDSRDRLGYASGHDVWRRAFEFLNADLRAEDLCCRLSGDEFLLILSDQGERGARGVVEALRRRWQPAAGTRDAGIQMNIGLASYPTHGCRIEQLLCAADEALHADRTRNEMIAAAAARRSEERNTSH